MPDKAAREREFNKPVDELKHIGTMETKHVIIRKAVPSDIDQMILLLRSLFAIEADFTFNAKQQRLGLELMLKKDGEKNRCIFVAVLNGEILGMCSIQTVISTAQGSLAGLVEDMVVQENWRRKGLGRRLLQAVRQWAEHHNIKRLQLLADKTNETALGFYEKQGWCTTRMICLRTTVSS